MKSKPDVAMCGDKVIGRWENSHWIVGCTKTIDGVNYVLERIIETAGCFYLVCKEAS